jgi:hypothetical protein
MEVLRRFLLVIGLFGFLWLYFDSPPALLRVRAVDFAREFDREYGSQPEPAILGVVERGRAIVRELTRPASLEDYVTRETEGRLVEVGGGEWEDFFAQIGAWTAGAVPLSRSERLSGGYAGFGLNEAPLRSVLNRIREIYGQSRSIVSYLRLGPAAERRYLEVRYESQPRQLEGPRSLQYPRRSRSWWFLLAGIALYGLLPWPRAAENVVMRDCLSAVLAMDFLGLLVAGLFFGIPLYAVDSTAAVFGESLGTTVFLWILALGGIALMFWAASNASFRIAVAPGLLRVSGLADSRGYAFSDIARVSYLKDGKIKTGIVLQCRDGSSLPLKWDDLMHFERVLEALKAAGLSIGEPGG